MDTLLHFFKKLLPKPLVCQLEMFLRRQITDISNIFLLILRATLKVLVAQSCPTLCDPMDCSPPGSSVHGILQARILEWVAIPFSRGSSWPRDQTWVSCTAGRFFTVWVTRETHIIPEWNRTTHALSLGQSMGFKSFREEGTQPSCLHLQERSRGYSGLSALQLPLVPFFTSSHFILTPFKCENWNWEALRDLSH